jgi:hypothetical protein
LEHILVDEEKHVDWIETQLHQITELGYQITWPSKSTRKAEAGATRELDRRADKRSGGLSGFCHFAVR